MGLTAIPRRVGKLEYSAVRLPLTLLENHVVARYWDDEAALRLGFERFLGSLDGSPDGSSPTITSPGGARH